jgi:hypothetical protein
MAKEGKERKNKERKMRRRSYPTRDCSRHLRCQERGGEMRNEEDGRGTDPGLSGTMGQAGLAEKSEYLRVSAWRVFPEHAARA